MYKSGMKKRPIKARFGDRETVWRKGWSPEEIESLEAHLDSRPPKSVAWLAALYRRSQSSVERQIGRIARERAVKDPLANLVLK